MWKRAEKAGAIALLEEISEGRHGALSEAFAERIRSKLLSYTSRADWAETERIAVKTISQEPQSVLGYRYLGEALMRQGKGEAAKEHLERAVELDPEHQEARLLLSLLNKHISRGSAAVGKRSQYWPLRQHSFADARRVVERFVLGERPVHSFIDERTVFITLGSCFASNLAKRLEVVGHKVHWELIGEEINSTYANRHLLDWIERGAVDGPSRAIEEVLGPERRARLRAAFADANVLVLTLGVAPCFFERGSGEFVFANLNSATGREYLDRHCEMRTTTVAENVANIEAIVRTAKRLAGRELQIVLTVSPVPLSGTREHSSAVLADCISKSTLRLACQEALELLPYAIYWPSFEIVRWLGAHYASGAPPAFGDEDGNTRHVSAWLVEMIVDLFISYHSAAPAEVGEALRAS